MNKITRCDRGYVVQAGSDEELVAQAPVHAREAHGLELAAEQVPATAGPT